MVLFLVATLLALACGPVLYAITRAAPGYRRVFDALVLLSIAALLVFEIIPHALHDGGAWGFAWLAAGFALPTFLERAFRSIREPTHWIALSIALAGLAIHALADGVILANIDAATRELGASIALHSLPIGLAVCWLLIPLMGWRRSTLVISGIGAATVVGFHLTPDLHAILGEAGWGWLQMMVAGMLIHALFGRPHLHQHRDAMADEIAEDAATRESEVEAVESPPFDTAAHKTHR
jgi:uncharacterized protein